MNITIEGTGIDYLYPDGVPIVEITVDIDTVFKKVARKTSIAVLADPYFEGRTQQQKFLSELHGNGSRIAKDFIEDVKNGNFPSEEEIFKLSEDELNQLMKNTGVKSC